jgi:hypothetical protein
VEEASKEKTTKPGRCARIQQAVFFTIASLFGIFYVLAALVFPAVYEYERSVSPNSGPLLPLILQEAFLLAKVFSLFVLVRKHVPIGMALLFFVDTLEFSLVLVLALLAAREFSASGVFLFSYLDLMLLTLPLLPSILRRHFGQTGKSDQSE